MKFRMIANTTLIAALATILVGCGRPDGPSITLPASLPSALVVVGAGLRADSGSVVPLIAGSARPRERLELVDVGTVSPASGVDPRPAPLAPSISGPVPPKRLGANPTQFQIDAHQREEAAYRRQVASSRRLLRSMLAARMRVWVLQAGTALAGMTARAPAGWDVRAALDDAVSYFSSLQQAGVDLGSRRVIVAYWPGSSDGAVVPLPPDSLTGATVVLADFPGDQREQAEWQADLLQAGASRAVVLVPGASAELRAVVSQALSGRAGVDPAVIRFGFNSTRLLGPARTALSALARELLTTYRDAPVTVLGFADPIGSYARNLRLSLLRALAAANFLVRSGVAPSRLFAIGYGPGLPVAASAPDGVQPLDRRVVVVIERTG